MAKAAKKTEVDVAAIAEKRATAPISLASKLSKRAELVQFSFWIIGLTPLITHAWSEKARREMLSKQVKSVKGGKEARDPESDFVNSLYEISDGQYGFPAMGIKNCILSAAHKDRGIPRSTAMTAIWLDAEMVRARPALAGAVCDMPLLKIFGTKPQMREDMVKIGSGINKIANLAYRGQFRNWGIRVTGELNSSVVTPEQLAFLVEECGRGAGIGEWRVERRGMFGSFRMANEAEEKEWEAFRAGKGPLQIPAESAMKIAAE